MKKRAPMPIANAVDALLARYEHDAERCAELGDERGVTMLRRVVTEMQRAIATAASETLSLEAAARESGYSADHLGRLVRAGKLRNVGRKNAPRVRRADLPVKPRRTPADSGSRPDGTSLSAIAREAIVAKLPQERRA